MYHQYPAARATVPGDPAREHHRSGVWMVLVSDIFCYMTPPRPVVYNGRSRQTGVWATWNRGRQSLVVRESSSKIITRRTRFLVRPVRGGLGQGTRASNSSRIEWRA
jgi:hypothetical protein